MRLRYTPPRGRMHDKVEVVLDASEVEALGSGVEVRKKEPQNDAADYTWIIIKPPKNFINQKS